MTKTGYMDALSDAEDLETQMEFRIQDIDCLRQAPLVVAPPVNPPIQQVPPGHSLNTDVIV